MAEVQFTAIHKRFAVYISILIVCLIILAGRIAWLQFIEGKGLTAKADTQLKEYYSLQSPRGTIYDRNGRELALSIMTKSLSANPAEINMDKAKLANLLAPILGLGETDIKERLDLDGRFVWLKRKLDHADVEKIKFLIKEHDITGLAFTEESKRYYPNDRLAAQVLGFVGMDDTGLEGIEMALDKIIKGSLYKQEVQTDSRGMPIYNSIFAQPKPDQGKSVYLTIDGTVQFMVEQSMDKLIDKTKAASATIVVMQPKTGEILAMASRPTYNPNVFYRYGQTEWKNRAVSIIYEPGSTFKSIVAAAALQEGVVSAEERFTDKGYVEVSGRRIKNWSGDSYGNINFIEVIKNSINTGFVQVGLRLGAERLSKYAREFGFGQVTGIGLPGEETGILFNPKDMRESDIATMSIGQSIAVTPLQLITAVSAIANDGVLLKPQLIKATYNADGTLYNAAPTTPVRQVISDETAHKLTAMLEKVVAEGGGSKAAVKGYRIAGKTGTAEKLRENGAGYYNDRYIASFVGYGPVDDPQLAVLVIIDDPQGYYYGGEIAAPVAGELFAQFFRHYNIAPQSGPQNITIAAQNGNVPLKPAGNKAVAQPSAGKAVVPDVSGKSMRQAGNLLSEHGFAMQPVGSGVAIRQSIAPNTIVDAGTEITVYFELR